MIRVGRHVIIIASGEVTFPHFSAQTKMFIHYYRPCLGCDVVHRLIGIIVPTFANDLQPDAQSRANQHQPSYPGISQAPSIAAPSRPALAAFQNAGLDSLLDRIGPDLRWKIFRFPRSL
ncbi:hypothetical protein ElyMa_003770200 [Elysia marginata]|uniref:Uncharacterized protein n=1 Tax=Elysia marginata TaxID=1093978 RepID=A0AAV4FAJ6_9GAST|nr:hypothetical protein ElyMa_003770200 [Elysia marginata]